MFQRIQHFFNTLSTNWSDDPGARGAAKMAAGGVLVAEGVFGVVRGRSGGKRQRGGLLGGIFGIVFGIIFINVAGFMEGTKIQDPVQTTGEIVAAERAGTNDDGQQMYRERIAYEVDGRRYEITSRGRQSWQPNVGAEVDVVYSASDVSNGQRVGGAFDWGIRAFSWTGWFIVVTSVFSLIISIALIIFGIWLFQQGRADRRMSGEDRSFFGDLFAIAKDVRAGNMDVTQTAAGVTGKSQGAAPDASTGAGAGAGVGSEAGGIMGAAMRAAGMNPQSGAATPSSPQDNAGAPEPTTAAAPPGWMLDPDDDTMLRWWNGEAFTEQRRPRD